MTGVILDKTKPEDALQLPNVLSVPWIKVELVQSQPSDKVMV